MSTHNHNHNHNSAKRAGALAAPTPMPPVKNFAKPHVCIDQWEITQVVDATPRLRGVVRNHPEFRDGELVITSSIVSYDPHGVWIETQSTIYILGIPAGMEGNLEQPS